MQVVKTTGSTAALTPIWNEAVGPSIAKNAAPTALYGDLLVIECSTAQWAEAVKQREAEIVARLDGIGRLRVEVRK